MHFLSRATTENLSKLDISPILQKSTANIICHLLIMQNFFWLEISVIFKYSFHGFNACALLARLSKMGPRAGC